MWGADHEGDDGGVAHLAVGVAESRGPGRRRRHFRTASAWEHTGRAKDLRRAPSSATGGGCGSLDPNDGGSGAAQVLIPVSFQFEWRTRVTCRLLGGGWDWEWEWEQGARGGGCAWAAREPLLSPCYVFGLSHKRDGLLFFNLRAPFANVQEYISFLF